MSPTTSSQFDSAKVQDFCKGIGTKICFASVNHPESNKVAKRANDNILAGLMKHLVGMSKGLWPEELVKTLWAIRTSPTRPTGFLPFKLHFRDEAMTPG